LQAECLDCQEKSVDEPQRLFAFAFDNAHAISQPARGKKACLPSLAGFGLGKYIVWLEEELLIAAMIFVSLYYSAFVLL
jgi:hypothetical protein